jgi:hypothetical protein
VAGCIRLRLGWRERMTCGVHYYGQFNLKSQHMKLASFLYFCLSINLQI